MDSLSFPTFIPFLLLLFFTPLSHSICPITTCPNTSSTPIRFPFSLLPHQPENCSYNPNFNLHCTNQGVTALTLPHSGEFLVRYISYQTQNIRIYDPNNCFPQRLLEGGFDLSGSPFQASSYVNYTFFRCPRNFTDERFSVVDCMSDSMRSVMATSLSIFAQRLANRSSCELIGWSLVPVSWPRNNQEFSSSLGDDVWLSWDVPYCRDCEMRGGVCGFDQSDIGCSYDPASSDNSDQTGGGRGLNVFRIIAFSIAIPAILCAMGVGIFLCIMDRRDARANRSSQQNAATTTQPEQATMGLDQTTIDSYTKVVLGESRRVPGLNDGVCPICLSDFSAEETLRCIPDCEHCFHADCIDEWLKMNGTCPLCRNSPAHHVNINVEVT